MPLLTPGVGRAERGGPKFSLLEASQTFSHCISHSAAAAPGIWGGLNPSCPALHEESLTPELGGLSKPKGIVALVSLGGPLGGSV